MPKTHPVTVAGCDGVLARGSTGEVYLNSVLATADRCWITLHISTRRTSGQAYDPYEDLQTWHEESLREFRPENEGSYDLHLSIDDELVELEFASRGNGGGYNDDDGVLHWTQSLRFAYEAGAQRAVLELTWRAVGLVGSHEIDLSRVAQTVRVGQY